MALKAKNRKQSHVEKEAGLSNGYLTRVFSGRRPLPPGEQLVELARIAGCTTDWLLTGEGEGPNETLEPTPTGTFVVERYPNRATALARARGLVDEAVINTVRSLDLTSTGDRTLEEWDATIVFHARARAELRDTLARSAPTLEDARREYERLRAKKKPPEGR